MTRRVLVAGIGNIFLTDDGFGSAVVQRLARERFPEGVRLIDFGIRGIHLAYELSSGYDAAILIDAAPRGGAPGTIYVIEPDMDEIANVKDQVSVAETHDLNPVAVLALLSQIGDSVARVVVVGCEPETVADGMGLSPAVAASVDQAAEAVRTLVAEMSLEPSVELVGG